MSHAGGARTVPTTRTWPWRRQRDAFPERFPSSLQLPPTLKLWRDRSTCAKASAYAKASADGSVDKTADKTEGGVTPPLPTPRGGGRGPEWSGPRAYRRGIEFLQGLKRGISCGVLSGLKP